MNSIATKKNESNSVYLDHPNDHYTMLNSTTYGISWIQYLPSDEAKDKGARIKIHALSTRRSDLLTLLASCSDQENTFIAVNQFRGKRCIDNLTAFNTLFADVDNVPNCSVDGIREFVEDAGLPPASVIVMSGRGAHVYWLFDHPEKKGNLALWNLVQQNIYDRLTSVGCPADKRCKDAGRILRLIGTVNPKKGVTTPKVFGLDYRHRYTLPDIVDWLDVHVEPVKTIPTREVKTNNVRSLVRANAERGRFPKVGTVSGHALRWQKVLHDLRVIKQAGPIPEGHRNTWLFLYAVAVSWFVDPLYLESDLTNAIADCGLSESEARNSIKSVLDRAVTDKAHWTDPDVETKRYRFKRETLWSWAEPLIAAVALRSNLTAVDWVIANDIRSLAPEALHISRKAKRHADRIQVKSNRATYLAGSVEAAKPWEALGISRSTYYRRLKVGQQDLFI